MTFFTKSGYHLEALGGIFMVSLAGNVRFSKASIHTINVSLIFARRWNLEGAKIMVGDLSWRGMALYSLIVLVF